jgi:hypothetical protein
MTYSKRTSLRAAFLLAASLAAGQTIAKDAIQSGHWTKTEQSDYEHCKSAFHPKTGTAEGWCEVAEEGKHWLRIHHKMAKDSDHAKFAQCNKEHAAEINGTPQQFYAAFDVCMREAYGLPAK